MRRLLLMLACALPLCGATYYVDNTATCAGNDGSLAKPWCSIAAMLAKGGGYAGENTIYFIRKTPAAVYRETLANNWNGTDATHRLIYDQYGTGVDTIISGAQPLTGFAEYTGGTCDGATTHCWSVSYTPTVALTSTVGYAWMGDTKMTWGTDQNSLTDHQYFFAANVFYIRDDSGNPDSASIEATSRNSAITSSNHNYVTMRGFDLRRTASYALSCATASTDQLFERITQDQVHAYGQFQVPTSVVFQNAKLYRTNNSGFIVSGASNASITFQNLVASGTTGVGISNTNTAAATITEKNVLWTNYSTSPISSTSANASSAVNVANNVHDGASTGTATEPYKMTAGTLSVANSVLLPDGQLTTKYSTGTLAEADTTLYRYPDYTAPRKTGLYVPTLDDEGSLSNWERVNQILNPYGIYTTFSVDGTNSLGSDSIARIQAQINAGNEIAAHTRDSQDLAVLTAMTVGRTATGSPATATYTKSANHVILAANGSTEYDLDLTAAAYDTIRELCLYIDGLANYTCTQPNAYGYTVPSIYLADVADQNIKSPTTYAAQWNTATWYPYEIGGSKSDLESTFTAPGGGALTVRHINWPINSTTTDDMINAAVAAGYESARAVDSMATANNWKLDSGVNLYKLNTVSGLFDIVGPAYNLTFDGAGTAAGQACKDKTSVGTNFTCNGTIAYDAADVPLESDPDSLVLDGSTTYVSNTASAANGWSDLHRGDFVIRHWIKPTSLATAQPIWKHGTDDSNYMKIYAGTDGSAVLSIYAGGSEVLHLATAAGAIVTTDWREVVALAYNNTYQIIVNQKFNALCPASDPTGTACGKVTEVTRVSANSTVRPQRYTGIVVIGCDYSYAGSSCSSFYAGKMDSAALAREGFLRTQAFLGVLASTGGVAFSYQHSAGSLPGVFMYPLGAAVSAFHGPVIVGKQGKIIDWIKAHGASGDNITYTVTQTDKSDYRPRLGSPLCGRGTTPALTTDLDGYAWITQDIGPYRCTPKVAFGGVM